MTRQHSIQYLHTQEQALRDALQNHDNINNFIDSEAFATLKPSEQLQTHEVMKSLTMYIKMLKALVERLGNDLGVSTNA